MSAAGELAEKLENTEPKTYPITVPITLTEEFLADVLCTAIEGGVDYWADISDIKKRTRTADKVQDWDYVSARFTEREPSAEAAENADGERKTKVVGYAELAEGIQRVLTPGFKVNDEIRGWLSSSAGSNDAGMVDVTVADVVIQAAMYGEIVYG